MTKKVLFQIMAAVVCATLLNGCVVALGNRVPEGQGKSATLGKQLTDLKQARDSGAITEEEYQTVKKRLVEGQ